MNLLTGNGRTNISIVFINGGRTPARDIERKLQVGAVNPPPKPFDWNDALTEPSESGKSFMPAGSTEQIDLPAIIFADEDDMNDFRNGKTNIYLDGEIRFGGLQGQKTNFWIRNGLRSEQQRAISTSLSIPARCQSKLSHYPFVFIVAELCVIRHVRVSAS